LPFPEPKPATIHDAKSHTAAGSTGLGKAFTLRALGHDPLLHATIGDDEWGRHIREACAARALATHFDIDPGGTSRHVNIMNAQGERISIFLFNGSARPPVDTAALDPAIAAAKTIFLNITQSSIPLLPLIAASSADIWVDLHDWDGINDYHRRFIAEADVVQFSDESVPDPRPLMEELVQGRRLVICTRGSKGAVALDNAGTWHEEPAIPANVVDSNGAGDAFMVAVWHALDKRGTTAEALRFGATAARLAVESPDLVPPVIMAW